MNKQNYLFIGLVVIILLIAYYLYKNNDSNTEELTFDLPTSVDPSVFGPPYWKAFEKLATSVPCSLCRGDAENFISFMHDYVNLKTKKSLYDKNNFDTMLATVTNLRSTYTGN
jgi:hypothetical protein